MNKKHRLPFPILFEDDDVIVIEKPAGLLATHTKLVGRLARESQLTAENLLNDYVRKGQAKSKKRVWLVHRLDRETSGLVIAARTRRAAAAMDNGNTPVHKEYLALVTGEFRGRVHAEGLLVHDRTSAVRKKKRFAFADSPEADAAHLDPTAETTVTDLIEESHVPPDMTLVRAVLGTGRQHQVRATLYSLGFPLAGDKLYGPDETLFLKLKSQTLDEDDFARLRFSRQALHAAVLEFRHPFTGELLRFESPFPRAEFGF